MLDLTRLTGQAPDADERLAVISRYATTIQLQRGDHNGRVLSLRHDDVRTLAVVLGLTEHQLVRHFDAHGALVAT